MTVNRDPEQILFSFTSQTNHNSGGIDEEKVITALVLAALALDIIVSDRHFFTSRKYAPEPLRTQQVSGFQNAFHITLQWNFC